MTKKNNSRTSKLDTRFTAEERNLVALMAQKEGISISEYLRNCAVVFAQSSIEYSELLNSIPGNKKDNAVEMLRALINEDKETTLNSIKAAYEGMLEKFERMEKLIGILMYVYFFHTPQVIDSKKKEARESAVTRVKKSLALIDDKQMLSTLSKAQSDE